MPDIQRYLNLVTSEHADKPNFIAWLNSLLTVTDDCTAMASALSGNFDLDKAIGVQLDILGLILGINRTVSFEPTGGISPILDDDTYRLILRAKIMRNQWNGTITQIYDLWSNLFPLLYLILHDNQDMSMTALVIGITNSIQADLLSYGYLVPKPEGVSVSYATPAGKVFGYGVDSMAFGGYGVGYWISYTGSI